MKYGKDLKVRRGLTDNPRGAEENNRMIRRSRIFWTAITLFVLPGFLKAQNPSGGWLRYQTPEEAGWSSAKLSTICQNANVASLFLVYDGKVVFTYGDYGRRFKLHSVRKSILSALYGMAVKEGKIDVQKSLKELKVDDKTPLTENEKSARIVDLLTARSGIYLPAAAEASDQTKRRPERGKHPAGEFFYYNNWDFNALGTIYRQETGNDIFKAFDSQISRPLGMEDFRLIDGCYGYESMSLHPAYKFKMSARDLARFGQLFLQNGRWNGRPVISETWVRESTTSQATTNDENIVTGDALGYGYLWWILENYRGVKVYYAAGTYGQRIIIVPALKIVLVMQSNSYIPEGISDYDFVADDVIFNAKVPVPGGHPNFIALEAPKKVRSITLTDNEQKLYCRDYADGDTTFKIDWADRFLVLTDYHDTYRFSLFPLAPDLLYADDIDMYVFLRRDEKGIPAKGEVHKSPLVKKMFDAITEKGSGNVLREHPEWRREIRAKEEMVYLANELEKKGIDATDILKLNALIFPYSFHVQQALHNALLKKRDLAYSAEVFNEIVQSLKKEGRAETKAEWLYEIIASQAHPQALLENEKTAVLGDYGVRHIDSDGKDLYYYVDPKQKTRLYRIAPNEFSLKGQFFRRIKFGTDDQGNVTKLIVLYYRDSSEESAKSKARTEENFLRKGQS